MNVPACICSMYIIYRHNAYQHLLQRGIFTLYIYMPFICYIYMIYVNSEEVLVILGKEMLCSFSVVKPDVFSLTLPRPLAGMGHSWDAAALTGCVRPL